MNTTAAPAIVIQAQRLVLAPCPFETQSMSDVAGIAAVTSADSATTPATARPCVAVLRRSARTAAIAHPKHIRPINSAAMLSVGRSVPAGASHDVTASIDTPAMVAASAARVNENSRCRRRPAGNDTVSANALSSKARAVVAATTMVEIRRNGSGLESPDPATIVSRPVQTAAEVAIERHGERRATWRTRAVRSTCVALTLRSRANAVTAGFPCTARMPPTG